MHRDERYFAELTVLAGSLANDFGKASHDMRISPSAGPRVCIGQVPMMEAQLILAQSPTLSPFTCAESKGRDAAADHASASNGFI